MAVLCICQCLSPTDRQDGNLAYPERVVRQERGNKSLQKPRWEVLIRAWSFAFAMKSVTAKLFFLICCLCWMHLLLLRYVGFKYLINCSHFVNWKENILVYLNAPEVLGGLTGNIVPKTQMTTWNLNIDVQTLHDKWFAIHYAKLGEYYTKPDSFWSWFFCL